MLKYHTKADSKIICKNKVMQIKKKKRSPKQKYKMTGCKVTHTAHQGSGIICLNYNTQITEMN